MATVSGFVQPSIPKFDGHYDHWSMLMENFMRSKEYWSVVVDGIPAAVEGVQLTEAQKKKYEGTARVQRAHRQALQKEFEMLNMKVGESVNEIAKQLDKYCKESKAYRLHDPISQKTIVSRDMVFDEDSSWDWDKEQPPGSRGVIAIHGMESPVTRSQGT
ncbi:hypothetical protein JRO89_XS03G0049700 [Xanthoceras sorbifolium]|uniref:Retroviral polymerase SH3-like domain-containing protein n=1 Tax=Xanthoceras sorbifolium TaxID=99658 RepID=A0ABQ8I8N6_9ROSI|nr:hypothetical protein JRO89_XS03G0049700 [Xanthoceras sorbifolium]